MKRTFYRGMILALLGAMPMTVQSQTSKTLVERLGYPAGSKLLLVHADDVGMSHNVNVATQNAMTKGWVSAASVMVPCPWFPEAAAMARENPELDLGIHLTLNAEWKYYRWGPVSPAAAVPGLLDENGFLWKGVGGTIGRATAKEVERELRAQVQRAIDFGIQPTHVDSHMGTLFARPDYFAAYRKVAHEFKIPYMVPRPTPELMATLEPAQRAMSAILLTGIAASGDVALDHLVTDIDAPVETRTEAYVKFIKELKPGVTQLIIHCGGDTEELRAITNSWARRVADARAFTDPAIDKALNDAGVHLIGWRPLKELQYPK